MAEVKNDKLQPAVATRNTEKPAPKKRGRKPRLDPELVAAAVTQLRGNVTAVAARFGVRRASVQELIAKRPTLQQILYDAREGMKDHAETALQRAVFKGEAWAVCFFLKTQAKDRGYSERFEHSRDEGVPNRYADMSDDELKSEISRRVSIIFGTPRGNGAAGNVEAPS